MTRAVLSGEKKQFYEKLGFDTNLNGSTMFDDLVEEVRILLDTDDINYSTIMKLLPSIEVEYYHFYYEVGRMKYLEDLKAFLDSRFIDNKRKKKSKTEYVKVFGTKDQIGVEKSIYIVAKLLNKERDLQKGNVKTLVKE